MSYYNLLLAISKTLGDSFYVLHEENYLKNIQDLQSAFHKQYNKVIIGYSYKTNYIPKLCQIAKQNGIYAEVVSEMELELALKLGYNFDKIIFNGPLKKEKDIEKALLGNSIINLDSYSELDSVENIVKKYPSKTFKVGLRINMSLVNKDGESAIQEGLDVGRFGFDTTNAEFLNAINRLNNLGVVINALHGHTSSSDRSLKNFETITKTLCNVRNHYNLNNIKYFNIGGGYFGPMPKGLINQTTPTFEDYATTIFNQLKTDAWFTENQPYVILEPGVSVVSNALSFVSKIMDIKKIRNKNFLLIEGGVYNIKPTFHKINLPFQLISKETKTTNNNENFDVVGSTCMEKDLVLNNVSINNPSVNDFIQINNVGGYTIVKTPNFINYVPAIISINTENVYNIIRHRQTINDLIATYVLN
ncbi:hypothetical protein ACFQ1R_00940 [Mariniflexile jejuense]|uniref:Orn/DAP/Arg decarboxylase 2 N-terminal domain-containing protein n=1 Tax=Mariniflexile jejuense TaxID=1173582 RepID=A0ABW3JE19_9FLAO